jgi:FkbM family methyltransferase
MTYILYGAGELGKLASQFFDFYNIEYTVCDDNPENYNEDSYWCNRTIYRLEDISIDNPLVIVCISTTSYIMIEEKLNNKCFYKVKPFFEVAEEINKANGYKHPLTNGWSINPSTRERKKIRSVMNEFYPDIKSYHNYSGFCHWHNNYEEWYSNFVNCNNRYFISEVVSILHDHETFIDAGAYDGRVSKQFIEIVKGNYNEIHCFEPDMQSTFNLAETIGDTRLLYLYNIVLGNKNGMIGFNHGNGYLSKVDKKLKDKVKIMKLDSFKYLEPTFIKYHLEGYELEAIKGSIKTIKKYRPIIAVTTYHTKDGLYKLPLYLIKNLKDYNFYWRNHNYQGQGAVMYCIPNERTKND